MLNRTLVCSIWKSGSGWDCKKQIATINKIFQFKGQRLTYSLLVSRRHWWVIHRGRWPQGRGSARTLVAGGLPLSDEGRPIIKQNRIHWQFVQCVISYFLFFQSHLFIWPGTSPDHASVDALGVEPILSALGDERLCGSSSSSFTVVAAQRGFRTMYLYFFQLHAFGSGGALTLFWRNQRKDSQLRQFVRKQSPVLEP